MSFDVKALLLGFLFLLSCQRKPVPAKVPKDTIRIAFLSDVHLTDVRGALQDIGYKGVENPTKGNKAFIRTMEAQLHSTRLFNENYFAFLTALDDVVKKGIKLVALPGDFSDDGQPINVRGLNKILNAYSEKHGISFFITTGNHDPTGPFGEPGGKKDFMGARGQRQAIMSQEGMYTSKPGELPVIVSNDIREMGYKEIVDELSLHGFYPRKNYIYWETPYTEYTYDDYTFEQARAAASLDKRTYRIAGHSKPLPDVSYMVEPITGLWLVALDANVYLPKENGEGYHGASIGYNQTIEHKKHLIDWVANICSKADELGKTVIAFSHYPMIGFNDGTSEKMKQLFGERAFQAHRIPKDTVAQIFADAGLKIHVGGHMHLNDTGIKKTPKGNTLVNIQVPSPAAYKPAYKILEIADESTVTVKTVTLDSVPGFDEFFPLYKWEHDFLLKQNRADIWNEEVLTSKDYRAFTNFHLEELVRLRFLPSDWPPSLKELLLRLDGRQLYILSHLNTKDTGIDITKIGTDDELPEWKQALNMARNTLKDDSLDAFSKWTGQDMIADFYRFRSADELALADIPSERIAQYRTLIASLKKNTHPLLSELRLFADILGLQMQGEPSNNFTIDLKKGALVPN
ncbi:metallophosphoesterase [Pseudozobellia thermophila]|uniref:Calcineurin-like phosphoesterase n=1 Tax=Pseudozobellia thermophila TaxID=192903 RepID=A0A1M6B6E6_9FLAO|nr:metallophosphoesterase [Pseudozobellia thermophila]SHI44329.1 Calcineurin-like phosphoesterase [Pseudozobellia thermophila]